MKRNFKYVKTFEKKINHKGETVWKYKKRSANRTTWAPTRTMADIRKAKLKRAIDKLKGLGLLEYFRPGWK